MYDLIRHEAINKVCLQSRERSDGYGRLLNHLRCIFARTKLSCPVDSLTFSYPVHLRVYTGSHRAQRWDAHNVEPFELHRYLKCNFLIHPKEHFHLVEFSSSVISFFEVIKCCFSMSFRLCQRVRTWEICCSKLMSAEMSQTTRVDPGLHQQTVRSTLKGASHLCHRDPPRPHLPMGLPRVPRLISVNMKSLWAELFQVWFFDSWRMTTHCQETLTGISFWTMPRDANGTRRFSLDYNNYWFSLVFNQYINLCM